MNIAGRILVLVSGVACLASMFMTQFDYGSGNTYTMWYMHRWDIAVAVLCVAAVAVAVLSWIKPRSRVWHGLTVAAGAALFGSLGTSSSSTRPSIRRADRSSEASPVSSV